MNVWSDSKVSGSKPVAQLPALQVFMLFHSCNKTDWNFVVGTCVAQLKPCDDIKVNAATQIDKILQLADMEKKSGPGLIRSLSKDWQQVRQML